MLKDLLGVAAIVAILFGGFCIYPRVELWKNDCGAGVMIKGHGGYWMQSKTQCAE